MKQILLLLSSFQFILGFSQAKISGTIYDDFGVVSQVSIVNLNSKLGTTSDVNGNFSLEISLNDSILISRLGYESKEIEVTSFSRNDIKLEMESVFDEVLIETCIKRGEDIIVCNATICKSFCCTVYGVEVEKANSNTDESYDILLFPNPSKSGIFNFKLSGLSNKLLVQVVSANGKILLREEYLTFDNKIEIDLSNFSNGIYFISITNNGKKLQTKRAIIAR